VFSVPEALMNTMSVEVPIILIATMTVSEEAGFIMLATRVMGLPMSLIGGSVAQAYLSEARHKLADRTLFSFTRSTMRALCMTGAIPVVSAAILSPLIFPLLFGHQWARSGYIAAWMAPWFFLQFVASPVSMILNIMGKQLLAAYLQATGLVIRIGAVWIAVNHFPDWTGEVFALSGAAFYLLYIWIILTLLRDR
jgi:O-antigen/teichoic acid export membrane protein